MRWWMWVGAILVFALLLALDLGFLRRRRTVPTLREALAWSGFWLALTLGFGGFIYALYHPGTFSFGFKVQSPLSGREAFFHFLSAFAVDRAVSVENVVIFALIFAFYRIPLAGQDRVLAWGILAAVALRGALIGGAATLFGQFRGMDILLGVFLLLISVRLFLVRHDRFNPGRSLVMRLLRHRFGPPRADHPECFLVRAPEGVQITPQFFALVAVLGSALIFAVSAVPASFAMTRDPFLVFAANMFSLLGLRALYIVLAAWLDRIRYFKNSLVILLGFVAVKILLDRHNPLPPEATFAVILGLFAAGIIVSALAGGRDPYAFMSPLADEVSSLLEVGWRQARKVVVLLVGSTVLLVGIAMIVLPGPAIVVIPLALAIFGLEFAWARRWLRRLRGMLPARRRAREANPGRTDQDTPDCDKERPGE